ncbi:NADPH-dependent F420 reductase [Puerhibacterium puerhi]|uniref:NADPH-dependent F420 reductase n=1 Tax=Puerhibacterium puerhi TaxID=2692623 RepID=UPI0013592B58|nr:NADPH-dependent F420 reductase [Puerhibacterium puerhi]
MATVSIIGTGNMGTAIAGIARKAGATVEVIAHADADKPVTGDVVVLAVPFPALAEIAAQRGEQLAGKVVVDITNPVDFATFDGLTVPADSSAAAQLQSALPQARVVKAFNTSFAATLASGTVGEQTTTVLVAGDDDAAKAQVVDLVKGGGLRALDAGGLKRARELEAVGFLQMVLAAREQIGWTGGFAVQA